MGIEVHRDGNLGLLVLDPSHAPPEMAQLGDTSSSSSGLRVLRKSEAAMKAKQYQIVAVIGMIDNEQQYQVLIYYPIKQNRQKCNAFLQLYRVAKFFAARGYRKNGEANQS